MTFDDNAQEAEKMAADCLAEVLPGCLVYGEVILAPSKGKRKIAVPAYMAAKDLLYYVMREQCVTSATLARKLGVSEHLVQYLLNPKRHSSPLARFEEALQILDRRLVLSIQEKPTHK